MKIFDLLAKSQLATYGRIQKAISGQNDITDHLQANAECNLADMLSGGNSEPLSSLHVSSLNGPLHEMFVIAKTPDSFLSDQGECQKMDFRWTTSHIAQITSSQIYENTNLRMFGGSAAREMESRRMYAKSFYDKDRSGHLLDYFDDGSLDRLDARLNEELFGSESGYVLRGYYEYDVEKYIVLLQGCNVGKKSTLFLATDWNAPLQQNFTYYSGLTNNDDFYTTPLIYPDNRDANCVKDNVDPFCSPCKEKENCHELFDCADGQYITENETYANIGALKSDFLLSFEVKIPSSGPTGTHTMFDVTTDNNEDINTVVSSFEEGYQNVHDILLKNATSYDEDYWMTVTFATHTAAGQRTMLTFIDRPSIFGSYAMVDEYSTVLGNGYHDQPSFKIVGGSPTNSSATPHEIRNAYFQTGSLRNIFN
ncbi:unnamed protein product [Oikopleura dioica]|uniref:Uncharacterized protein n=1 Tax=Oikopleura dioica TaxID=34765 RepID=E4Y9E5_OIKDI|nr:unnamed protein product [Oikopleura dioica]